MTTNKNDLISKYNLADKNMKRVFINGKLDHTEYWSEDRNFVLRTDENDEFYDLLTITRDEKGRIIKYKKDKYGEWRKHIYDNEYLYNLRRESYYENNTGYYQKYIYDQYGRVLYRESPDSCDKYEYEHGRMVYHEKLHKDSNNKIIYHRTEKLKYYFVKVDYKVRDRCPEDSCENYDLYDDDFYWKSYLIYFDDGWGNCEKYDFDTEKLRYTKMEYSYKGKLEKVYTYEYND